MELVAHLAALELRPSLYAAQGYGSLYAYCTEALHLPEDAACNRIQTARACRRFPKILDLLAAGSLTFSTVRMLRPHLTEANHESVLARAVNRKREEIQVLVAELAPQPDVVASVRKLPARKETCLPLPKVATVPSAPDVPVSSGPQALLALPPPSAAAIAIPATACATVSPSNEDGSADCGSGSSVVPPPLPRQTQRPIVRPLAPERYRVQFTIGQQAHDQLRRLQTLLRREIPNGDAGLIFEQALGLLLERVEKAKLGAGARRRSKPVIRPGADKTAPAAPARPPSRHIPNDVKRAVWWRDAGQCSFVSDTGRRCTERTFLELHHIQPYAMKGPPTIRNIALRCRLHNQYEAEIVFGARVASSERAPRRESDSS